MPADLVVFASSDPEGFGRIIIEAQAMGRPVVTTAHDGSRQTIVPWITGWLAPPHDPAAFAVAIGEAPSFGASGRSRFARRSIAHVASRFTRGAMFARTNRSL